MSLEKAIETAYSKDVSAQYSSLSLAILSANGDDAEITAAEARFSRGLAHAADIRERARRLAGLG